MNETQNVLELEIEELERQIAPAIIWVET